MIPQIANPLTARMRKGVNTTCDEGQTMIAYDILGTPATQAAKRTDIHVPLRARLPGQSEASTTTVIAHALRGEGFDASDGGTGRGTPLVPVAFEPGSIARNAGPSGESEIAPTLRKEMGDNKPAVRFGMHVRRLTPVECERLQGFPDGYTAIPWRGKDAADCPDGPRYKALGNSMAVPVMRWIGQRLQAVDGMTE